jgi:hypothetical protein
MSENIIFVLMHHRHKLLDLIKNEIQSMTQQPIYHNHYLHHTIIN